MYSMIIFRFQSYEQNTYFYIACSRQLRVSTRNFLSVRTLSVVYIVVGVQLLKLTGNSHKIFS
jgi:hypothetical protein